MTQYVKTFIVTGAAVASLAVAGVASAAQQHSRTRRPDAPPATHEQSRPQEARPAPQARPAQPAPRSEQARPAQPAPRSEQARPERPAPRTDERREQPQRQAGQRYAAPRYQVPPSRPTGSRPAFGGVPYRTPRFYDGPRHVTVYRPYYSFRPRFSIGFGLFLGYAVPYPTWYDPYDYYYDYGWRDSRPYGSYAPALGGISFDLSPWNAEVWIDGDYVGIADDFSPSEPPLTLAAGRHHVQLMARGFQTVEFDLTVVPGQVIPYQGTLPRW